MKLVTGGATAARVMLAGMAMVACMQAAPVCAQRMDPDVRVLRAILEKPEAEIDLARARLAIDQLIDPAVDIEDTLAKLDAMAATVKALAGPRAKSAEIAQVLRSYLYDAGTWNHRLPFRYDLEGDPLGREIPGKLLTNYLATRKGNCVSMPTLASAKPRSNYPLLQMVNAATQCARVVAASIVLMMATATTHEALAESLEQCIDRFCVGPRAKSYDVWASSLGSRTGAAVPGEDARRTLCASGIVVRRLTSFLASLAMAR